MLETALTLSSTVIVELYALTWLEYSPSSSTKQVSRYYYVGLCVTFFNNWLLKFTLANSKKSLLLINWVDLIQQISFQLI